MTNLAIKSDKLISGHLRYDHLLGREFVHGETDCYTLCQDFFRDNLGLEFQDYARPDDWWLHDDFNPYWDFFGPEGFTLVDINHPSQLKIMDLILVAIPDPRRPQKTPINHCAMYIGNGKIIHHRLGKLSTESPYQGWVKEQTVAVVRHKDAPELQIGSVESKDLMDFILPHKKALLEGALDEHPNS